MGLYTGAKALLSFFAFSGGRSIREQKGRIPVAADD
jgi:hypothetical protein